MDGIRDKMGVALKHLAFYWRSEATNCDYKACGLALAKNVRRAQELAGAEAQACVLVTDIPLN